MLRATSVAPVAVTFISSVVSNTTLLPDNNSSDEPAGIGAFVTNSTAWFASLFAPALADVSEFNVTVAVICPVVVFPNIHPRTTVVVDPATVYITSSDVTPAFVTVLNVFAISVLLYYPRAIAKAVASLATSVVVATVPVVAGSVKVMFPLNAL